ncbi:MAG: hypothetical protein JWN20_1521, partial [Jatrophihabitantaceae bacterium]|nr:hypothetical protein [Jatrophihabitantaceae bacterium]
MSPAAALGRVKVTVTSLQLGGRSIFVLPLPRRGVVPHSKLAWASPECGFTMPLNLTDVPLLEAVTEPTEAYAGAAQPFGAVL